MAKAPGQRGRGRPPGAKNKAKGSDAPKEPKAPREAKADPAPKQQRAQAAAEKQPFAKADLEVYFGQALRYQGQASEASGNLGQATEQFCTEFGFNKTAVSFARRVFKMMKTDQAKAAFLVKDVITIINTMGWGEEKTLFDDEDSARQQDAVRTLNRDSDSSGDGGDEAPDPDNPGDEGDDDVRPAFLKARDESEAAAPMDEHTASNVRTLKANVRQLGDSPGSYKAH